MRKNTVKEISKSLKQNSEWVKNFEKMESERLNQSVLLEKESSTFVNEYISFGYKIKTTWDLIGEKILIQNYFPL